MLMTHVQYDIICETNVCMGSLSHICVIDLLCLLYEQRAPKT